MKKNLVNLKLNYEFIASSFILFSLFKTEQKPSLQSHLGIQLPALIIMKNLKFFFNQIKKVIIYLIIIVFIFIIADFFIENQNFSFEEDIEFQNIIKTPPIKCSAIPIFIIEHLFTESIKLALVEFSNQGSYMYFPSKTSAMIAYVINNSELLINQFKIRLSWNRLVEYGINNTFLYEREFPVRQNLNSISNLIAQISQNWNDRIQIGLENSNQGFYRNARARISVMMAYAVNSTGLLIQEFQVHPTFYWNMQNTAQNSLNNWIVPQVQNIGGNPLQQNLDRLVQNLILRDPSFLIRDDLLTSQDILTRAFQLMINANRSTRSDSEHSLE